MRVTRRDILPKMPKAAFTAVPTVHAVGTGSQGGFGPSALAH
jgi:hypothetical protein